MKERDSVQKTRESAPQGANHPGEAEAAGVIPTSGEAEPKIWTERMLAALKQGVKGRKWHSLYDKVTAIETLWQAWGNVHKNAGAAGVDGVSVERFEKHVAKRLGAISKALTTRLYNPTLIRRTYIPKADGKMRPLGIPTVGDRVVQTALRLVIEPIFEHDFSERSYGFRPGRGCKDALREVDKNLKAGNCWVVDADLKSYFDTIPHEPLMRLVEEKIADGSVLNLIRAYLKQGVLEEGKTWTPDGGTPQGAVISLLLANLYLDPLDKLMQATGRTMIRYADDFVVMCKTRVEAETALEAIRAWTAQAGLTLHPEKTKLVNAAEPGGFDFLGYHFERGYRWPRKKSLEKVKDTIRTKTPRNDGRELAAIVKSLNRTLRGWFEYFKHSIPNELDKLDKWIRMRLRAILRRREKGVRNPYGLAHSKWPIAFFDKAGVFSLKQARARICRPKGTH